MQILKGYSCEVEVVRSIFNFTFNIEVKECFQRMNEATYFKIYIEGVSKDKRSTN